MTGVLIPPTLTFPQFIEFLKQDYPNAIIPRVTDDKDWQRVATLVISDPVFSKFVCPRPDGYAESSSWMQAFVNAIY